MRVGIDLSVGRIWLREDAEPGDRGGCENGCGFTHVDTIPSAAASLTRPIGPPPCMSIARALSRRKRRRARSGEPRVGVSAR